MWGEGLEDVEELQRDQEGGDAFLGAADSSVDQQHRTTFSALKHARSSYKPAILMDSEFLVDSSSGVLGGRTGLLRLEVAGSGVREVTAAAVVVVVVLVVVWGKGWRR